MMIINKRDKTIDFLKGIGIILMIFGHLPLPAKINCIIYSFHMPLFFFLSGYVYKSNEKITTIEFIKKKAKQLLYPYYIFALIDIVYYLMTHIKDTNLLNGAIVKSVSMLLGVRTIIPYGDENQLGLLWFLPCLFLVEVIYFLVRKIQKYQIIVILLLCISQIYSLIIGEKLRMLFCADVALNATFFYMIGNEFKKYKDKFLKLLQPLTLVVLSVSIFVGIEVVVYIYDLKLDLVRLEYGMPILSAVIASLLCVVLYIFCSLNNFKNKYIVWIGENSLYFLLLNKYTASILMIVYNVTFRNFFAIFDSILIYGLSLILGISVFTIVIKKYALFLVKYPNLKR